MSETLKDLIVRAALVKRVEDAVRDEKTRVYTRLRETLTPGDRMHATLPDGTDIGTISYSRPAPGPGDWAITDEGAYARWLSDTHPDATEVKIVVRDWAKGPAQINAYVEEHLGEVPPGVAWAEGRARTPSISTSLSKAQREALEVAIADATLDVRALLEPAPSEPEAMAS